jgi:hypothetical protein
VSEGGGGRCVDGLAVLHVRARGRVGWLNLGLGFVNEVPVWVVLFALVVARVLFRRVLVRVSFGHLEARRVFVAVVVLVARVVVDGNSFPKFDGDVSVALRL